MYMWNLYRQYKRTHKTETYEKGKGSGTSAGFGINRHTLGSVQALSHVRLFPTS